MKSYNKIRNKKKFQEYLDGLLLGDGCISSSSRKGCLPCFKLTIRTSSIEWAQKVRSRIISFGLKCYIYGPYNRSEINLVSETHPFFWKMRKRWYAKAKKTIPRDLVITPTTLGNWYLGDGKLDKDDVVIIYTESFQFDEVDFLADLLNKAVGVFSYVKSNEKGNPIIKVRACEVPIFLAYISKECKLKCFKYKFNVKSNHQRMKWLSIEDDILRKEYNEAFAEALANRLRRSLSSIYHRVNRLGLRKYEVSD